MNGDNRVGEIVLAAEHLLGLGRFDDRVELVEPAREVRFDVFAAAPPLHEHVEIVETPAQRVAKGAVVVQASPALHDLLRLGLAVPEGRFGYLLFDFGELFIEAGALKDTSGVPPRAGSGLRIAVSVRRKECSI
jgi:hypothetical protein